MVAIIKDLVSPEECGVLCFPRKIFRKKANMSGSKIFCPRCGKINDGEAE